MKHLLSDSVLGSLAKINRTARLSVLTSTICMMMFATSHANSTPYLEYADHFKIVKQGDLVELSCPRLKPNAAAHISANAIIDCPRLGGHHSIIHVDGKQGVIRQDGQLVLAIVYDDIELYDEQLAKVKIGDHWGLASLDSGVELSAIAFDTLGTLSEGRIAVKQHGKAGHMDSMGNITTPMRYHETYRFDRGVALVKGGALMADGSHHVGLVDLNGTELFEPIYHSITPSRDTNHDAEHEARQVMLHTAGGHTHLRDLSGKPVTDSAYATIDFFYHGYGKVSLFNNDLYGYIDTSGAEIIEPQYRQARRPQRLGDQVIFITSKRVGNRLKWGAVNAQNQVVVDWLYDHLSDVNGDYLIATQNSQKGTQVVLLGTDAKPHAPSFDSITPAIHGHYIYGQMSHEHQRVFFGILHKDGSPLTDAIYDEIGYFYADHTSKNPVAYRIVYQGKVGMLSPDGTLSIPPLYDDIDDAHNGNLYPKLGEHYAIYNKATGTRIQLPHYRHIQPLMGGYTKVFDVNGKHWQLLDGHGKNLGKTSAPKWYTP